MKQVDGRLELGPWMDSSRPTCEITLPFHHTYIHAHNKMHTRTQQHPLTHSSVMPHTYLPTYLLVITIARPMGDLPASPGKGGRAVCDG